jgi:hypothetical protein
MGTEKKETKEGDIRAVKIVKPTLGAKGSDVLVPLYSI